MASPYLDKPVRSLDEVVRARKANKPKRVQAGAAPQREDPNFAKALEQVTTGKTPPAAKRGKS